MGVRQRRAATAESSDAAPPNTPNYDLISGHSEIMQGDPSSPGGPSMDLGFALSGDDHPRTARQSPATAPLRAIAYLRVSSQQQAKRDGRDEGLSIPAQRELVMRSILDKGWTFVDEYVEPGRTGRNIQRPQFQAMLDRIAEQRDVDVVVTHKLDRLARNAGDYLMTRSALEKLGVRLVSVAEPVEQNAAGRMIEGVLAVLAEHYSDNLSAEVKKGQAQKAKNGGFPHRAPLGYLNVRKKMNGGEVAYIEHDPDRAPLLRQAFELYATGAYSLEQLAAEMSKRGLTSRHNGPHSPKPLTVSGLHGVLTNPFHVGKVCWNGIKYDGTHEPLIGSETFRKVQELLASRAGGPSRERKHNHYLKGLLVCGVCGRKLSIQKSKGGRYTYYYCLGQKSARANTGCREAYVAADKLEQQVENLYRQVQLPTQLAAELREELEAEFVELMATNVDEQEFQRRRQLKLAEQRRKLMHAFYANAISLDLLKEEQKRLDREDLEVEVILNRIGAKYTEWRDVLDLALRLAEHCGAAYLNAAPRSRRLFNSAILSEVRVAHGRIAGVDYLEPFSAIFTSSNGPSGRGSNKRGLLGRLDAIRTMPELAVKLSRLLGSLVD